MRSKNLLKNTLLLSTAVIFCNVVVFAQNGVSISTTNATPHPSAMLDVSSSSKGVLIPKVKLKNLEDITTIPGPAKGLLVWNTNNDPAEFPLGDGFYTNYGQEDKGIWIKLMTNDDKNSWRLKGNIADPSTHFLGTTNNVDLNFRTNNTEVMKLTAGGALLLTGNTQKGQVPIEGPGTRLEWIPAKGAVRIGGVSNKNWDSDSIGKYSFASGYNTKAKGQYSVAIGGETTAKGIASTAMGNLTTASGESSTAMGRQTHAKGTSSTAIGIGSVSEGTNSTAIGEFTLAQGYGSTTMGKSTIATGKYAIALGIKAEAAGDSSTAIGSNTSALGINSITIGNNTTALGYTSTAMGFNTTASGAFSTSMGLSTNASGYASTAMGFNTIASGLLSTAFGNNTLASSDYSTAMGRSTIASGYASTAMGYYTTASESYSTAIGDGATASGKSSVAIGSNATASGTSSTAMGISTTALGINSTAIGDSTTASGIISTAMGTRTIASGRASTTMGYGTIAASPYSVAIGSYNTIDPNDKPNMEKPSNKIFQIGNGINDNSRSDALYVTRKGDLHISGCFDAKDGMCNASDIRLKNNIIPLKNALQKINLIQPIYFDYKDKNKYSALHQIGFSAQEIERTFPELVRKSEDGYLAVNYAQMTAVAIQAVKEQQVIIKQQQQQIDELTKQKKQQEANNIQIIKRLEQLESGKKQNK